ncbi:MAG TPA: hypothetical protein VF903_12290 [Nitrospirota bacterium]
MRLSLFVIIGFLLAAPAAFGEQQQGQPSQQAPDEQKRYLYEWTDSKGAVHVADELGKVPKQYRSTAKRREAAPGTEDNGNQGQPVPGVPYGNSLGGENQAGLKSEWQQRMRSAKERLSALEQRYRELDQKRNELLGSWGGAASGRLAEREQAAQIEEEMKRVKSQIDDARNQVENVIPDEARKAGVPPGWLRE